MVQAWNSFEVVVQKVKDKLQQIITVKFSKGNQNEVLQKLFSHMQTHSGSSYISKKLRTWKYF